MKATEFFFMLFAAAAMLSGCKKYDDTNVVNRIGDLEERVTSLEEATAALKARLDAGFLIKSVTPITDAPGGWRIEFTGGSPSTIDILNGEDGASSNPDLTTPQFEVRESADGSSILWVDYGNGWTDTGVDLTGPTGEPGPQGDPGDNGVTPHIKVRENDDNTVTVWYNITAGYPAGGWVDTGYDLSVTGPVLGIVRNGDGTATFTMNDADPTAEPAKPATTFIFREATVPAPVRVEVRTVGTVGITEGMTGQVVFVVNPSDAAVDIDDTSLWELDRIATRAGYVDVDDVFSITAIEASPDGEGRYTATIEAKADSYDTADNDEHIVALIYNAGSAAEPSLISSGSFVLQVKPILNRRITWDDENGRYVLTTDPTDAGLYFKFGSVAGIYSGDGANQTLPATTTDPFNAADVAWSPTAATSWALVPVYADDPAPVDDAYHTAANVKAGKGDPCRLVGLDLDKIADIEAGLLTDADIDNGKWRLPVVDENKAFTGYSTMTNTNAHWTTQSGVGGGMFPNAASGDATMFLPAAGYRNYTDGAVMQQGNYGWYYASNEYDLVFLPDLVIPMDPTIYYGLGFSVRCVPRQ